MQHRRVDGELHQLSHRHAVTEHEPAADQQHQHLARLQQQVDSALVHAHEAVVGDVKLHQPACAAPVPGHLGALADERLDHPDAAQHVLHHRLRARPQRQVRTQVGASHLPDPDRHQHDHRCRRQDQQAELPVLDHDHDHETDQQHHLEHTLRARVLHEHADIAGVVAHGGGQVAGRPRGQEREREALDLVEHRGAQAGGDAGPETRGGPVACDGADAAHRVAGADQRQQDQDRADVEASRNDEPVNQDTRELRRRQSGRGTHQVQQQHQRHGCPVRFGQGKDPSHHPVSAAGTLAAGG